MKRIQSILRFPRTPFSIYVVMVYLFLLIPQSPLNAQVNTESLRLEDLTPGSHFSGSANFSLVKGNSDMLQSKTEARYDLILEKSRLFAVVSHKISSESGSTFINQGFGHFRYVKPLLPCTEIEFFTQQEFNEFINLQSRSLIGSGLRSTIERSPASPIQITWGAGLMVEDERMDEGLLKDLGDPVHGDHALLLRSTNYVVLKVKTADHFSLQTTSYFQVDTQRLADHRVLSQSQMMLNITKRLSLNLALDLRYDSEPPGNINNLDIELSQGLVYRFK